MRGGGGGGGGGGTTVAVVRELFNILEKKMNAAMTKDGTVFNQLTLSRGVWRNVYITYGSFVKKCLSYMYRCTRGTLVS